mmetsp:Transcript_11328/g.32632  ORF Transcript_11328/g.32632 Transcript_11328/m.32632 type:complete len:523 (+) Transcript_11328:106-1674(+)
MSVVKSRPKIALFHSLAALQVLVTTAIISSVLSGHSHSSAEAFLSSGIPEARINRRSRTSNDSLSRPVLFATNMASAGNQRDVKKAQQKYPKRGEPTTSAAPMYITIGPQCCGKSSFLKDFEDGKVRDISLDDQCDVYVPISTETFLNAYDDKNEEAGGNKKAQSILQQVYQGKTLLERIRENIELILILRRWNGDSSASDFDRRIRSYYKERNFKANVAEALVAAVEQFLLAQPQLPPATDVFVLESLFKPHPDTNQSAIQRAYEELRKTPRHVPVAWGNTNAKARDYEQALEICHQTRRPVRFVLCHPGQGNLRVSNADSESELLTLPWVSFDELLKRNLQRLQTQGRFIPANAIADCQERVVSMVPSNLFADTSNSKSVEEHLVSIASPGYGRNDNRRFKPRFRYSLTTYRLVQKQCPSTSQRHSSHQRRHNQNHSAQGYCSERGPRPTKKPKSQHNGENESRPHRFDRQRNDSNRQSRNRLNDRDRHIGDNQHPGRQYRDRDDPRSHSRRRNNKNERK